MNTTRLTVALTTALAIVVLAGCSSSSSTTTSTVNRADPQAVSDAFAAAWAGADLTIACSYMGGSALKNFTAGQRCSGTGAWAPQAPVQIKSCHDSSGGLDVFYSVPQQVNRFLIFGTQVTQTGGGTWAVTGFSQNSPGEQLHGCETAQPNGTS